MRKIILIFSILSSGIALIGLIFVSIFGNISQNEFYIHLIGAVVYFIMGMVLMILYTLSMVLSKKFSKIQVIWTLITLGFFISLFISAIPLITSYPITDLLFTNLTPNERMAFLEQNIPLTMWLTFFEWLFVIANFIWFIITGLHTLKIEKTRGD